MPRILPRINNQPFYHILTIPAGTHNCATFNFFENLLNTPRAETNFVGPGNYLIYLFEFTVKAIQLSLDSGKRTDFEKLIQGSHFCFSYSYGLSLAEGPGKLFLVCDTKELYQSLTKAIKNPQKAKKELIEILAKHFDRNYKGFILKEPITLVPQECFRVQLTTNPEPVILKEPLKIMCLFEGELKSGIY